MKIITQDFRRAVACAAAALTLSPSAFAAGTWAFSSGSGCTQNAANSGNYGNSYNCTSSNASDPSATATGWSTNGAGSTFAVANVGQFGTSGFGVRNSGEGLSVSSPNHAMDNSGNIDVVLLSFTSSVILSQMTTGWAAYDSDISVLRYVGPANQAPNVSGKTASGLLSNGWELVGNYGNTVANVAQNNNGTSNNVATNINSSSLSSSYWLVSAYSSSYGGNSVGGGSDYVKLLSVFGATPPGHDGSAPEPASLALVAVALAGAGVARRRNTTRG